MAIRHPLFAIRRLLTAKEGYADTCGGRVGMLLKKDDGVI